MSTAKTAVKKAEPGMGQLTITLCVICVVCALLLGMVNLITADKIAAAKAEKTAAAMREVLAAEEYQPLKYEGSDAIVAGVYQAGDAGWVVQVGPSGFGGVIDMVVGIKADGTVSGISIIKMSETSGLGTNAKKEGFRTLFTGGTGPFAVNKDGGEIQAITGATITSRAVTMGVNAALDAVKTLG